MNIDKIRKCIDRALLRSSDGKAIIDFGKIDMETIKKLKNFYNVEMDDKFYPALQFSPKIKICLCCGRCIGDCLPTCKTTICRDCQISQIVGRELIDISKNNLYEAFHAENIINFHFQTKDFYY